MIVAVGLYGILFARVCWSTRRTHSAALAMSALYALSIVIGKFAQVCGQLKYVFRPLRSAASRRDGFSHPPRKARPSGTPLNKDNDDTEP